MAQSSLRMIPRAALPGLLISAAATIWCWWTVGANLGLFLGTILFLTLYTPPIVLAEERAGRRIATACVAIGAATVLAFSTASVDVTAFEWFRCGIVLAAYAFALTGFASLLTVARFPAPIAAGITIFLFLAWLTWPVWLSPWLTQALADWLTPANPLLAINGIVKQLGTWDRAPIAYRSLTVLNQDIPYHLPTSIIPAVLLHLAIGAPGMIVLARDLRENSPPPAKGKLQVNPNDIWRQPGAL